MKEKRTLGTVTVTGSFVLWGFLPLFWNLLAEVNPVYILAERIVWSVVFMGLYLLVTRRMGEVIQTLKNPKTMLFCFACGMVITFNWGIYIYSVNSGHVLDASMGYFIEPVIMVAMGVLAFREKPRMAEKIAFVFAVLGIVYLIIRTGTVPKLALLIAAPFAVYGAMKKNLKLSAEAALFLETLLMLPFAMGFILYWNATAGGQAAILQGTSFWLLPACGVVTSVPLLLFNIGVKEIPFYLSGMISYVSPTLQFLVGVLYFKEAINANQIVAFVFIWIGVLIAVVDKVRVMRAEKKQTAVQTAVTAEI